MRRNPMCDEPENTHPEAGQHLEADLQDGITQDPGDLRAEGGKL
jgi:hypothetical protein